MKGLGNPHYYVLVFMFILRPKASSFINTSMSQVSMVGLQSDNLVNSLLKVNVKYCCDDDDLCEVFCQTYEFSNTA
jgi:hypothetical protein